MKPIQLARAAVIAVLLAGASLLLILMTDNEPSISDNFKDIQLRATEASIGSYIATRNYYGDNDSGTPNTVLTIGFSNDDYCDDAGAEPLIIAEMYVKETLRAPSTAKFTDLLAASDGPCRYRVHGRVDSQNGFGAMVRTNFTFRMRFDPELGRWRELDVSTY